MRTVRWCIKPYCAVCAQCKTVTSFNKCLDLNTTCVCVCISNHFIKWRTQSTHKSLEPHPTNQLFQDQCHKKINVCIYIYIYIAYTHTLTLLCPEKYISCCLFVSPHDHSATQAHISQSNAFTSHVTFSKTAKSLTYCTCNQK